MYKKLLVQKLKNIHKKAKCVVKVCPFHKPSNHHMRRWKIYVRFDRGMLVERLCEHGIGHPDPDSLVHLAEISTALGRLPDEGVHGCDGCCNPPVRQKQRTRRAK